MKKYRRLLVTFLLVFILLPVNTVQAKEHTAIYNNVPVTGTILYDEEDDGNKGNTFITEAIQSIDSDVAKKEKNKDYIKNFYNSSQTVMTEGLNLLKPHTIVMVMVNFITMILELIGIAVTFVVMILYNFVSTSFMSTTVQGVFSIIERVMFDWSNPNSWIIKVLVIMTVVSIGYQLVKNFTKMTNWRKIMQVVLSAFISMSFIIFIGQSGRKIVGAIEQTMQEMITQTFVFDGQDQNMEIANKENIFEILQMQPFMIRHYGTASYNKIANDSDQSVGDAKNRVKTLLSDPSEDNADTEYDDYHNTVISHDVPSTTLVLFLSAICLIHRVLIAIILAILCVVVGAIKLMKEIMLALSVYQLIWWLFRHDHKAREWFTTRVMWSIATIAVDILFSAAMYFLFQVCKIILEQSSLIMIAFDIILLAIIRLLIKNASLLYSKIKDAGGAVVEAMITGSMTPMEFVQSMSGGNGSGIYPSNSGNGSGSGGGSSDDSDDSDSTTNDDQLYDSGEEEAIAETNDLVDYEEEQPIQEDEEDNAEEDSDEKIDTDDEEKLIKDDETSNEKNVVQEMKEDSHNQEGFLPNNDEILENDDNSLDEKVKDTSDEIQNIEIDKPLDTSSEEVGITDNENMSVNEEELQTLENEEHNDQNVESSELEEITADQEDEEFIGDEIAPNEGFVDEEFIGNEIAPNEGFVDEKVNGDEITQNEDFEDENEFLGDIPDTDYEMEELESDDTLETDNVLLNEEELDLSTKPDSIENDKKYNPSATEKSSQESDRNNDETNVLNDESLLIDDVTTDYKESPSKEIKESEKNEFDVKDIQTENNSNDGLMEFTNTNAVENVEQNETKTLGVENPIDQAIDEKISDTTENQSDTDTLEGRTSNDKQISPKENVYDKDQEEHEIDMDEVINKEKASDEAMIESSQEIEEDIDEEIT